MKRLKIASGERRRYVLLTHDKESPLFQLETSQIYTLALAAAIYTLNDISDELLSQV